jgi:hypothetical protein
MAFDQAQSARLGQKTPIESTYVQIYSGDELPEASWPGQIIYRSEEQFLQVFNGNAWEDVVGGHAGTLTFVGPVPPVSQTVGDVWFDSSDANHMYRAASVGADSIGTGEWEDMQGAPPVPGAKTFRQDTPPPVAAEGDLWFETDNGNKQYYYHLATWVSVRDDTIATAQTTADQAVRTVVNEYSLNGSETVAPTTGWSTTAPPRTPGMFIWFRTTTTLNSGSSATTSPALLTGNTGAQGTPGTNGAQGVPGPPGTNGQPTYTWIKYASDSSGTALNDLPAGMSYMGIAYNKTTPVESTVPTDYEWSLIQGATGPTGSQGVPGPAGADGQPRYTWIKYADTATGTGLNDSPVGKTYMGIAYNKASPIESGIPTDYEWSLIQGPQGVQGPPGSQGIQGPAGPNGVSLYTWIKYADTPTTGMTDFPAGKAYMGIAYNKSSATESSVYADYEWNLTQGAQGTQGIPGPTGPNGQPTYTWVKYGTSSTGAGLNDSPTGMTYMGIAYNKTTPTESTLATDYEWSLIQGPQGISITAVLPYFAAVAVGAAAPALPVVATPPAPWVTPEPVYAANTELYRTEKVSYSNSTFSYTPVSKVSSYSGLATKTKAFYQGQVTVGIPVSIAVGDIWYDTDDSNHPYYASAIGVNAIAVQPTNGWWDAKDPNIDLTNALANENSANIEANQEAITDLNTSLENVQYTAFSAQNSADTADGRVSMSDYAPGPDDVMFDQTQLVIDPDTGLLTEATTQVPRANGSIWFMRTRPRQNLCTNPSFEAVVATDWTGGNLTTINIVTASPALDGIKVAQLTNTSGAVNHYFQWSTTPRQPCVEGQGYTASAYTRLISGTGSQISMSIVWYDSTGTVLATNGTVFGDPVDLIVGGVVQDWQRPWITVEAPTGAASFVARVNSPAGNPNDVWQVDGMQVEASDELGRYFDGDAYDCSWDGTANLSTATMEGTKIIQVYELHDGDWVRKWFTDDTLYFLDAAKLVGSLDAGILTDNTIAPDKMIVAQALASETLAAGDLVHVWNNNGVFQLQKACAAPGLNLEVHGFVLDPVPSGTFGKIYHNGYNPFMSNLAPGLIWLSTTPGKVSKTPPTAIGSLVQRVGYAPSATVLDFHPVQSIKIT